MNSHDLFYLGNGLCGILPSLFGPLGDHSSQVGFVALYFGDTLSDGGGYLSNVFGQLLLPFVVSYLAGVVFRFGIVLGVGR